MAFNPNNPNGQAAMANSEPVVIASDQTELPTVEQYAPGYEDNTNNVAATQIKPIVGTQYVANGFAIFGTDVDLAVKTSAGNLFSITVSNVNAAIRYLQIHNKASAPAATNVPVISLPIPAGSATVPGYLTIGRDQLGPAGYYLVTGIAIGISTTNTTFTAATTTDHNYFGTYV